MPHRPQQHRPPRPAMPESRPNSAQRGYGHKWRLLRLAFLRANPLCVECAKAGRDEAAVHCDHIIAREKGGSDDEANLQGLCHSCHSRKTVREDGGLGR